MKTKKAWAVVHRTPDIYWLNSDIGLYTIFPTYNTAKNYLKNCGEGMKIIKVDIVPHK